MYVAAVRALAMAQLTQRRALVATGGVPASTPRALEVEILLEMIHGARLPPPDAALVAARLVARGIRADVGEVAAVLLRHGLTGKKTAPSRSPRSRR